VNVMELQIMGEKVNPDIQMLRVVGLIRSRLQVVHHEKARENSCLHGKKEEGRRKQPTKRA